MERNDFADTLVSADASKRGVLLAQHAEIADVALARALKDIYYSFNTSDPQHATDAATALDALAVFNPEAEIRALADWITGLVALQFEGKIERAIQHIGAATARFETLNLPLDAAPPKSATFTLSRCLAATTKQLLAGLPLAKSF